MMAGVYRVKGSSVCGPHGEDFLKVVHAQLCSHCLSSQRSGQWRHTILWVVLIAVIDYQATLFVFIMQTSFQFAFANYYFFSRTCLQICDLNCTQQKRFQRESLKVNFLFQFLFRNRSQKIQSDTWNITWFISSKTFLNG